MLIFSATQPANISLIRFFSRTSNSAVAILPVIHQCDMGMHIKTRRFNQSGKCIQILIPGENHHALFWLQRNDRNTVFLIKANVVCFKFFHRRSAFFASIPFTLIDVTFSFSLPSASKVESINRRASGQKQCANFASMQLDQQDLQLTSQILFIRCKLAGNTNRTLEKAISLGFPERKKQVGQGHILPRVNCFLCHSSSPIGLVSIQNMVRRTEVWTVVPFWVTVPAVQIFLCVTTQAID